MNCSGPCLPHCYKCSIITVYLSKIAITYTIATVFYKLLSSKRNVDFVRSLDYEKKLIYEKNKKIDTKFFCLSIILSSLISFRIEFKPS